MPTDTGYRAHDPLRVCDICGVRYHFSELKSIGELRWACPDDAPGLTANQISRINARARPLTVKPVKWAKPVSQIPTYAAAEAATFNFIVQAAPADTIGGSSSAISAAWAAIYMADVINQGQRPAGWIATARTVLRTCVTFLLTQQFGSPTGVSPTGSAQNPRYGGILSGGQYPTQTTVAAGVAFLKAYRALGDITLLQAADRVGTFVRHMQCGDLHINNYTVYPAGGGAYHVGGLASAYVDGTSLMSASYTVTDVGALWFLALLVAVRSPSAIYGDGAATSFFSAATAAPLSQIMAEMTTFAVTGPRDAAHGGATVSGLSLTAPRTVYVAATNIAGGAAAWTTATTVGSDVIAQAVNGLYQAGGATATVAGILSWLASFGANPANATPIQPQSVTLAGLKGTYDPTLCVATTLTAAAPFTEATGTTYGWSAQGILSAAMAAAGTDLRRTKDTLAMPRRTSTKNVDLRFLGPQGQSGLSLQVSGTPSTIAAAKAAMIYRQAPGMYPRVALY